MRKIRVYGKDAGNTVVVQTPRFKELNLGFGVWRKDSGGTAVVVAPRFRIQG